MSRSALRPNRDPRPNRDLRPNPDFSSGFTLALGGGGARGWAHLGVMDALAERQLTPGRILGTSMGAVVGAGMALGLPVDRIAEMSADVNVWRMARRGVRFGIVDVQPIIERLVASVGDPLIEDLPIPFGAAAFDLATGEHRLITTGRVADALLRSCTVNILFKPMVDGDVVWADAGIWEPVPISLARAWSPDPVVGVQLIGPKLPIFDRGPVAWSLRAGARLLNADHRNRRPDGRLDARRYAALLAAGITHPITIAPADLLIVPRLSDILWVRFGDVERPRRRGYEAAREALVAAGISVPEAEKVTTA
jgi:predicted acylesterase/phospholipase RssA